MANPHIIDIVIENKVRVMFIYGIICQMHTKSI